MWTLKKSAAFSKGSDAIHSRSFDRRNLCVIRTSSLAPRPSFRMTLPSLHRPLPCVRIVDSFLELARTPFGNGVNALCYPRQLPGDFGAIVDQLGAGEAIVALDEAQLRRLRLDEAGCIAVDVLLADLQLLRDRGLDPVLNCIRAYPEDEEPGPVKTDVFSWHADSAPIEADTWLCTYCGAPSEGLRNEEAVRKIDIPETRRGLLARYGGAEDEGFRDWLREHCYDLHYAPLAGAQPYPFGRFNLWRIAVEYPGSPCAPCIHRAPATVPGEPRLLLIS